MHASVLVQIVAGCGCRAMVDVPRVDRMEHALAFSPPPGRRAVAAPADTLGLTNLTTFARAMPAGARIAVQSGCVWLTQAGDANDYFVSAGDSHVVTRPGRVVIESLTPQAVLRVMADATLARPGFP